MKPLGPWRTAAAFFAAYAVIYALVQFGRPWLSVILHPAGAMQVAAVRLTASSLFLWIMLGVLALVMRTSGGRLTDLGFARPGAAAGWVLAAIVFGLQSALFIAGPIGRSDWLTDWSPLRIGSAVVVAVSAGVCEEAIFRGFFMTQARRAGLPLWIQILASALLFGLAHAGWGMLSGRADAAASLGAMVSTAILGGLLAITYALGRRSLWPVMIAHGLIDLVAEPWLIMFALGGGFQGHMGR